MIDQRLLNPFGVAESDELPHVPRPLRNWTEYCYFFGYDANAGHGISIHIGREPTDPTIWRGTMGIYLPNNELLVAKYFGRDGNDRGPGAGPLQVRCIEPMRLWSVEFNGLAERVQRSEILNDVHRDTPAELASFHLIFEGAAPFWDLDRSAIARSMVLVSTELSDDEKEASRTHHWEQICKVRGEITVKGKTHTINGGGVRDHSHGPRDYAPLIGNVWVNAIFPSGRAIMTMGTRVGENYIRGGYIFWNDGSPLELVKLVEYPFVGDKNTPAESQAADPLTDPKLKSFRVVVETKRGNQLIEGELQNAMGTTYLSPNFELVGTDRSRVVGGSQLAECATIYRWDGETGVGLMERIAQMPQLRRTNGRS